MYIYRCLYNIHGVYTIYKKVEHIIRNWFVSNTCKAVQGIVTNFFGKHPVLLYHDKYVSGHFNSPVVLL